MITIKINPVDKERCYTGAGLELETCRFFQFKMKEAWCIAFDGKIKNGTRCDECLRSKTPEPASNIDDDSLSLAALNGWPA